MPKISALTAASAPDADDLLYIVEDGNSRKATVEQVGKAALNAAGSAPIYACRAWVNFDGTGAVAIRGSGNVSSITDFGVGSYTVNFTTAMLDENFAVVGSSVISGVTGTTTAAQVSNASSATVYTSNASASLTDADNVYLAIFR
jgi:hypothetical protein